MHWVFLYCLGAFDELFYNVGQDWTIGQGPTGQKLMLTDTTDYFFKERVLYYTTPKNPITFSIVHMGFLCPKALKGNSHTGVQFADQGMGYKQAVSTAPLSKATDVPLRHSARSTGLPFSISPHLLLALGPSFQLGLDDLINFSIKIDFSNPIIPFCSLQRTALLVLIQ